MHFGLYMNFTSFNWGVSSDGREVELVRGVQPGWASQLSLLFTKPSKITPWNQSVRSLCIQSNGLPLLVSTPLPTQLPLLHGSHAEPLLSSSTQGVGKKYFQACQPNTGHPKWGGVKKHFTGEATGGFEPATLLIFYVQEDFQVSCGHIKHWNDTWRGH